MLRQPLSLLRSSAGPCHDGPATNNKRLAPPLASLVLEKPGAPVFERPKVRVILKVRGSGVPRSPTFNVYPLLLKGYRKQKNL